MAAILVAKVRESSGISRLALDLQAVGWKHYVKRKPSIGGTNETSEIAGLRDGWIRDLPVRKRHERHGRVLRRRQPRQRRGWAPARSRAPPKKPPRGGQKPPPPPGEDP